MRRRHCVRYDKAEHHHPAVAKRRKGCEHAPRVRPINQGDPTARAQRDVSPFVASLPSTFPLPWTRGRWVSTRGPREVIRDLDRCIAIRRWGRLFACGLQVLHSYLSASNSCVLRSTHHHTKCNGRRSSVTAIKRHGERYHLTCSTSSSSSCAASTAGVAVGAGGASLPTGFLMEAPTRDDNNDDANRHPILSIRRGYRCRHCLLHNPDPPKRIRRAEGERSQSVYGTAPLPQDDGTGKIDEKDATDAPPLRRASCLQSLAHGSMSVLGRRRDMEDAVTEVTGLAATAAGADGYAYFAVYDGHGGPMVARACRDRLHVVVAEEVWRRRAAGEGEGEGPEMWWRALEAGFARVDAEVMEASRALKKGTVGSTAVVAEKWIVVANCGDSRAVLSRGGVAVPLSIDHKVEFPSSFYPHFFRS
ncbi:hypothetical protein GW17_00033989 [Ensete ventricosum]|nr:hypothetical protein GW17_00033989 [Ensete ventricosum]